MQQAQTTSNIVMCMPKHFGFNEQTGADNEFQHKPEQSAEQIKKLVAAEFDAAVNTIRQAGVHVSILSHPDELIVPDAIFPNNWFTTSAQGTLAIFPMKTPNRQKEVVPEVLSDLLKSEHFEIKQTQFVETTEENVALEGTGSIVFDHLSKTAFAAISERCHLASFESYCKNIGYRPVDFTATSSNGMPIYHTNVVMSVGSQLAVICGRSLGDNESRVIDELQRIGKTVINISMVQMENSFCGNIIELKNNADEALFAMSQSAWDGFTPEQKNLIEQNGKPIVCKIPTIEHIGGGSLRCMIAENFLSKS